MKFRIKTAISVFGVAVLGAALFLLSSPRKETTKIVAPKIETPPSAKMAAPPAEPKIADPRIESIGLSAKGRKIQSYTFGNGNNLLVFIGGIHGGYEWNSVILAYELIDYLDQNRESIPKKLTVTVIPSLNPDGVFKTIRKEGRFTVSDVSAGSNEEGRLNANGVDLNRNFGCNWKAQAVWKGNEVSGGKAAFSEPESAALKQFVLSNNPAAVIFWHSQSNTIYGSQCGHDMLPETVSLMNAYSKASGYKTAETFTQYEVTGDATDWLASIDIPAMTVELATHNTIELDRNLAGVKAIFKYFEKSGFKNQSLYFGRLVLESAINKYRR
ncbi:MAG: M14 family metallopeptidase [Candidatus Paceibacterota bacterium]